MSRAARSQTRSRWLGSISADVSASRKSSAMSSIIDSTFRSMVRSASRAASIRIRSGSSPSRGIARPRRMRTASRTRPISLRQPAVRCRKLEEVAEPGANLLKAFLRDRTGDPRQAFPGERARLLRHDPGRTFETARPLDAHVIRPSAIDRSDRQDDRQGRHRIEIACGGHHENWTVTALLPAANRLERRPGDNSRCQLEVSHAAGRTVPRAPMMPTPRRETCGRW